MIARVLFAWLLLGLAGCAGRMLPARAAEHGSLLVAATHDESEAREHARESALPLVVLVERARVVAIDPIHARVRWTLPFVVAGHPVASADTIVLPLRGQKLAAIDRATGHLRFLVSLPGEALTGVALSEPWIVATIVDRPGQAPAQILGISTEDGDIRWRRRAEARMGVPDVVGDITVVGIGDQIAALRLDSGREVARVDVAGQRRGIAVERVTHREDTWFVGGGTRFAGLRTRGADVDAHELARTYAPAFPTIDGIDSGHGDDERLRLWVRLSGVNASPRDGILLARRAVVAVRLDAEGRPVRARWVHVEEDHEIVAMEVVRDRVVLVREDGAIVQLADDDGRTIDRIVGGDAVRGALIVGGPPRLHGNTVRADDPDVVTDLHALVGDRDPRLLPAQRLAVDLLWRHDDPRVRASVRALARGELRPDDAEPAAILRDHATELLATRWGSGSSDDVAQTVIALRRRPAFGDDESTLTQTVRAAVRSGDPAVIDELSALLLHPGTRTDDLVAIVDALAALGDPRALPAVATFVQRYHADDVIAGESTALVSAAALLLAHAGADDPGRGHAYAVLRGVVDDPMCDARLRSFVWTGLRELPAPPARTEHASTHTSGPAVP